VKKLRVYVDTSVLGGCIDDEYREISCQLIEEFKRGQKTAIISDLTMAELAGAPREVREVLEQLPNENVEYVETSQDAIDLADQYILGGAVTKKHEADALHIALATTLLADVLVSWNFRHIVNIERILLFNGINIREGYRSLEIRSPLEVISREDQEDD